MAFRLPPPTGVPVCGKREPFENVGDVSVSTRICHLIDSSLGSAFFRSIASRHDHARFPVMIGSVAPAGNLQQMMNELDTPTFTLNAASRRQYPQAMARLVRLLRREGIGIIHSHCFDPTAIGLIAARLAGIPFVFTRHHSEHHVRMNKRWHIRADAYSARFADHVIAVSDATRRIMTEIEGVPERQITVVYNGMEAVRQPTAEGVTKVREELGLAPDARVCLMMGRLHEEKGHRFLFEAIPQVVAEVGETTFLLAGAGDARDALEAEVNARGLQPYVRFLGFRNDVPELIALSTVIVQPSLAESFGFALLEAMSFGKPVVGSTTGGIPEVVADGETGLLVPPGDSRALADALCCVLLNPEQARSLGAAGRVRAAAFTFENMIRGYEKVYERVIPPDRAKRKAFAENRPLAKNE